MKHCNCDTEINRDGSSQLQRFLNALDPTNAPVDGRSTADLLVFAKKYAAQIRFYDIPESRVNDTTPLPKISWREFFRRDMAVIASSIAVTNAADYKMEFEAINEKLQQNTNASVYAELYGPIIKMIKKIDGWFSVAIPENPLYADLNLAIISDLKMQAQKVLAYEEGFKLVDPAANIDFGLSAMENKEVWGLNETIPPDASIYAGTKAQDKILNASLFTEDIFYAFYNFLNKLIANAEQYLLFAMEQYPAHQPHMALFISFLLLFQKAQNQMNGLTEKLLDFYYKEVLHLETKPSFPDKAHVVFELAKDVVEYDIAMATALKAGPDASGNEQVYTVTDDLVVNQAKVKELKTIFIQKTGPGSKDESNVLNSIFARPIADSADGFGQKFESDDIKWPTFGKGMPDYTFTKNPCEKIQQIKDAILRKDQSSIGFAIASPQLLLQGGKRLIELRLDASIKPLFDKQEQMGSANVFTLWFTGDKEWFKVDSIMSAEDQDKLKKYLPLGVFNPNINATVASYYLSKETNSIFVYLPQSAPQVIGYDSKIHTAFNYNTKEPVLQVMLNPVIDLAETKYNGLSVKNITLAIKVGSIVPDQGNQLELFNKFSDSEKAIVYSDGLSKLLVQDADLNLIQLGRPFDPFTAYPNKGKSFYIGSDEVFNKPLSRLAVDIKKTGDIGNEGKVTLTEHFSQNSDYEVSILENRKWTALVANGAIKFSQESLRSNILYEKGGGISTNTTVVQHYHPRQAQLPVSEWDNNTVTGFLRITNLNPVNTIGTNGAIISFMEASQNLAHELEIKELSLSYESELKSLESGTDAFFHVYPFGNIETNIGSFGNNMEYNYIKDQGSLTQKTTFENLISIAKKNALKDNLLVKANNILFPQFTYKSPYSQLENLVVQNTELNFRNPYGGIVKENIIAAANKDALAEKLLLEASGLQEKIKGGNNQYSGSIQEEGMLFIGLENAAPLQMVTMLFQFAEGSAANEDEDPPPINWSYLTNNEWRPMKIESLVADGTAGFQTTGIIKIEIPENATNNNTLLTKGLYWLCASVTKNSNRIPMLIKIITQAVLAQFKDNNNDPSHFDKALPKGSINKLVVGVSEISSVAQPFASFDGKHKEIGKEFYPRVSERLRHKARAITPWDYEHLVLDRFPSVYKVKCITHTDPNCLCTTNKIINDTGSTTTVTYTGNGYFEANEQARIDVLLSQPKTLSVAITAFNPSGNNYMASKVANNLRDSFVAKGFEKANVTVVIDSAGQDLTIQIKLAGTLTVQNNCCGPQIAPGHVLLVPISNLKNRNAVNPLQPKTSRRVLLDIASYLQKRCSPFVHVHAKNPVYEQVLVFFRVKFYDGYDKGFYTKKLNESIVDYLTPWAFDENAELKFGQKIYASSIINFIEERFYVDFITDFLMVVCRNGCCEDVVDGLKDTTDEKNILDSISGCSDMEILLEEKSDFTGDVIAKPATARSLLVSAPHHIIIPYQEPVIPTACEVRKSQMNQNKIPEAGKPHLLKGVETANTGIVDSPPKLMQDSVSGKPKPESATIPAKKGTLVKSSGVLKTDIKNNENKTATSDTKKTVVAKPVKKNIPKKKK